MNKKLKKILALLLAFAIIATQFAVSVIAADTGMSTSSDLLNSAETEYHLDNGGTLITYDGPSELGKASEIYAAKNTPAQRSMLPLAEYDKISITAAGYPLYVYATGVAVEHGWYDNTNYTLEQRYTPITYFDFEGSVDIKIDVSEMGVLCTDGASTIADFSTATVSPINKGVDADITDNIISFTITQSGNYTVVLDDDEKTAIHIFANEIESPELGDNIVYVNPSDTGMPEGWKSASAVVFMPGDYQWGNVPIWPQSNQIIYLMGGAVVHSNVQFNGVSNSKLIGRGIIDDSESQSWKIDDGIPNYAPINCCSGSKNLEISGITVLNPSLWMVMINGVDTAAINNVHLISGKHNGDGISVQSSCNITVTNSFIRSWDDTLVVKNRSESSTNTISSHEIVFRNNTLWTDLAQSMEIGYETNQNNLLPNPEIYDVTFEDITVIYNLHKVVMSIHNGDNADIHHITYKNIVVEHADMGKGDGGQNTELIEFSTTRPFGGYAATSTRGKIHDITVENINVLDTDRSSNSILLSGSSNTANVSNVTFKNIKIKDKFFTGNGDGSGISISKNNYVSNVQINKKTNVVAFCTGNEANEFSADYFNGGKTINDNGTSLSVTKTADDTIKMNGIVKNWGATVWSENISVNENDIYILQAEMLGGSFSTGVFVLEFSDANNAALSSRLFVEFGGSDFSSKVITFTQDQANTIKNVKLHIWFNGGAYQSMSVSNLEAKISIKKAYTGKIVEPNEQYGSLPNVKKSGYVLSGWYKEPSFINKVNENTVKTINGNQILYAKWSRVYKAAFVDSNPSNVFNADYFEGGKTISDNGTYLNVRKTTDDTVNINGTVYNWGALIWSKEISVSSRDVYVIQAEKLSGSVSNGVFVVEFTDIQNDSLPQRVYMDFNGNATKVVTFSKEQANAIRNVKIRTWYDGSANNSMTISDYTASISINKADRFSTVIYGENNSDVLAPQKLGYTFDGYFDSVDGGTSYYSSNGIATKAWDKTTDACLYAHWSAVEYNISYNLENGAVTDNGFIYGLKANMSENSFAEYLKVADGYSLEIIETQNGFGTGTMLNILNAENETVCTLNAVIFGDVNGDGYYDGTDAVIVSCITNGMLTREQTGEAAWLAADCNHDSAIDSFDVQLLQQAGLLIAEIQQSEVVTETLSLQNEYAELIEQTFSEEQTVDEPIKNIDKPIASIPLLKLIFNCILNFLSILLSLKF